MELYISKWYYYALSCSLAHSFQHMCVHVCLCLCVHSLNQIKGLADAKYMSGL